MRGYPRYNFDAFDAAAERLRSDGWIISSPADIDRAEGFDPDKHHESFFDFTDLIKRDVAAILATDYTIVLPGWQKSTGATTEVSVARWAQKKILLYPSLVPIHEECVLEEAGRLTRTERQNQYGPPEQDFARTAAMWSALKGIEFSAQDVALFMICLKLSRQTHQKKRDNWVDIAGYARCGSLIPA